MEYLISFIKSLYLNSECKSKLQKYDDASILTFNRIHAN